MHLFPSTKKAMLGKCEVKKQKKSIASAKVKPGKLCKKVLCRSFYELGSGTSAS